MDTLMQDIYSKFYEEVFKVIFSWKKNENSACGSSYHARLEVCVPGITRTQGCLKYVI